MNEKPTYWFSVKRYGWGWGLPARWQGWVVLAVYFGMLLGGLQLFRARSDRGGLLLYLAGLTAALIVIIVIKGERPVAWRWGKK